ncbi:MAG: bifunctional UDP-N-acetylmuramoyl-tripeptide:D-alanyl-D-alanine ligase/alanine racemase, partial [Muribaculaceae bacterium]|nr:bifunctional UDP-N-acetylmuramoyl-tripeptide:D-alanyl-D-alanine ligase/alanine racemase [Muribaculaceae bacterium]
MTYSIAEIACMLNISGFENDRRPVSILLTDSRSLTDASQSLFFALSTPTNDGHNYITDLYRHGVRAFVVTHIHDGSADTMPDAAFIIVPDVTTALQSIAKAHRMRFKAPVIGITGSAGKTTVKEWLYSILGSSSLVDRSPRSYNSQIGVPLSVWGISDKADYAIIEAGISRSGEMSALRGIIKPDIGIITGIGHEHDEGFESLDRKCREKLSLFTGCHTVIFNADDQLIRNAVSAVCHDAKLVSCSRHDASCALFVEQTLCHDSSTALIYNFQG